MKTMLLLLSAFALLELASASGGGFTYADQTCTSWGGSCCGLQNSPRYLIVESDNAVDTLADDQRMVAAYTPATAEITHGSGMSISPDGGTFGTITYDSKSYVAIQFHIHCPSEHTIDVGGTETTYDCEIHVVHQNTAAANANEDTDDDLDDLLVVGVFLEVGETADAAIGDLIAAIPWSAFGTDTLDHDGEVLATGSAIDVGPLLGVSGGFIPGQYWRYEGSLTTPPCTESVHWFVLKTPLTITSAQKALYTDLGFGATNRLTSSLAADQVSIVRENTLVVNRGQYQCPATAGFRDKGQCSNSSPICSPSPFCNVPAPTQASDPVADPTPSPTNGAIAAETTLALLVALAILA